MHLYKCAQIFVHSKFICFLIHSGAKILICIKHFWLCSSKNWFSLGFSIQFSWKKRGQNSQSYWLHQQWGRQWSLISFVLSGWWINSYYTWLMCQMKFLDSDSRKTGVLSEGSPEGVVISGPWIEVKGDFPPKNIKVSKWTSHAVYS